MPSGYLALVLHAHLPFVRHPEHEQFFEEDWLFEAITETYIPLLKMMQRLVSDGVPFKLTMSLTPTLCAMLQDELLRERYLRHLDLLLDLSRREIERNRTNPALLKLTQFYLELFSESRRFFVDEWKCDLLAAFRQVRDAGALEIIASAATHGLLPLIYQQSHAAARAQVLIGRDEYIGAFNEEPRGFWLPECGYTPGLEWILQEANVRWFILDAHGLMHANPRPQRAVYAPCYTPAGPAVLARDRDSSRQVWSAQEGYPGDAAYREFYRDIGFDLPTDHLGPLARGIRKFAGVKYHRITGRGPTKDLYDPEVGDKTAHAHAIHFLEERRRQIRELGALDFDPIVVVPFDAELFGHWLDRSNTWIYPHLHANAYRMSELARAHAKKPSRFDDRVLKQLAREFLLAQASDWAFLMKTGTAKEYAAKRTMDHLVRFNRLHDQFVANNVDKTFLEDCEWRDNLFPDVNWRYYVSDL